MMLYQQQMLTATRWVGLLLCISTAFVCADNPVANTDSVVQFGNARFTVLTSQLIRMEYSTDQQFEDRASLAFVNRNLPTPRFTQKIVGKSVVLVTEHIQLNYRDDDRAFHDGNLQIDIRSNKKRLTRWTPNLHDDKNLKGTLRTLDQAKGWDFENRLEQGIVSRSGWALVDDSDSNVFDGAADWNWVTTRDSKPTYTDWYLFAHGTDYKKALFDFTQVAGKIPMPPKYALGYWWSRYWIYNDHELRDLVKQFRDFKIPQDVLVIDMDWHETYGFSGNNAELDPQGQLRGWTGYTWNKKLFPQPEKFIQWTNSQQLKTALNLHPASGVPNMEEKHEEFSQAYSGKKTDAYIPYKMSEKKWAQTYFKVLLKPMEQWGIDFWWLDWQQYLMDKDISGLSVTWWLNYTFFTHMEKTAQRPMIFHRWGGLGNHRYPIGFSGDAFTSWQTLDFETYFTATAANVGYGYWSHDIGGHIGDGQPTDGELYLRWIQFGALSPILRTHSSKISTIERRPWMFSTYFSAMRDAINLRYQLSPYIYAATHNTYTTGVSLLHPLYYDYPNEELAYEFKTQYMFGDTLLAAPITSPIDRKTQLAEKKIWLPKGEWFELSTGTFLRGDKVVTRYYALNEIPLFAKSGSIIPMSPEVKNLQEKPRAQILAIVPGGNSESIELYEDDETTNAYQQKKFTNRRVSKVWTNNKTLYLSIEPIVGSYDNMPQMQTYTLKLLNSLLPKSIYVNGQALTAEFSHAELATSIYLPALSVHEKISIEITFNKSYAEQILAFNGNKGFLQRVNKATEKLKFASAQTDWGGTLPNAVYDASNIINQLLYQPEEAYGVLLTLNNYKKTLRKTFQAIPNVPPEISRDLVEYLELK